MTKPSFKFLSVIASSNQYLYIVDEILGLQIVEIVFDANKPTATKYIVQGEVFAIEIVDPLIVKTFDRNVDQIISSSFTTFVLSKGKIFYRSDDKFIHINAPIDIVKIYTFYAIGHIFAIGVDKKIYGCLPIYQSDNTVTNVIASGYSIKLANIDTAIDVVDMCRDTNMLIAADGGVYKFHLKYNSIEIVKRIDCAIPLRKFLGYKLLVADNNDMYQICWNTRIANDNSIDHIAGQYITGCCLNQTCLLLDADGIVYYYRVHYNGKFPLDDSAKVVDMWTYPIDHIVVFKFDDDTLKFHKGAIIYTLSVYDIKSDITKRAL